MNRPVYLSGIVLMLISLACTSKHPGIQDNTVAPVEFNHVSVEPGFWQSRIRTARDVTIPYAFNKCEETGRIDNFIFAAGIREGKFHGRYGFDDSDVYKIIEGASYSLMLDDNPELDAYLDTLVGYIAGAQEDDGYLYTAWTLKANDYNEFYCCSYSEEGRFKGTSGFSHEFYDAGHMYEAAVAHFLATGKRSFLDVAIKNADLIYDECITRGNDYFSGHQEIEVGLAKLYRVTGDERYLELAKHLLDLRGYGGGSAYSQSHIPVTQQHEAVGHAVRANYMYTAMADIAALTADSAYLTAIDAIWENVVSKKLSISGGVGARAHGEAYGRNYELPNRPYNETCAAIANVYWNHRMFLLHGDSKYIDVLERTLYNGLLSGISLEGSTFFYPNTLMRIAHDTHNRGNSGRSPWFDCSCCPSNLSRFIPSVASNVYAVKDRDVYINLFMNSTAEIPTGKDILLLRQSSNYPWEGNIRVEFDNEKPVPARLNIRIPGWLESRPVPSDLFRYAGDVDVQATFNLNGEIAEYKMNKGYAVLEGKWKKGDLIEISFPMMVRQVLAHDSVQAKKGFTAFEYGPVVYCAEEADNGGTVVDMSILPDRDMRTEFNPDLLGGINMIHATGIREADPGKEVEARLIPYYAWAHRGEGEMTVWFRQ